MTTPTTVPRWKQLAELVKFWMVDVWGRDWDAQRRTLLYRHYRAYFRNPPIPPTHLPVVASRLADEVEQRAYTSAYRAYLADVQSASSRSESVHLTYRPLGKNLRLLGTAIRDAAEHGRAVRIAPEGPATEVRALGARGHAWSPWVWVRTGDASDALLRDAAKAWNSLFRFPEPTPSRVVTPAVRVAVPSPLPRGTGPFSAAFLTRVLQVATATRYALTPHDDIMADVARAKAAAGWPAAGVPVLAMHIRRGDAAAAATTSAGADQAPALATRRSFALEEYLSAADEICARDHITHIFLATESKEEIARAVALRPQYTFLWLAHDRSLFPDIRTSTQFIEDLALDHPERARALTLTAILDLHVFCDCHAFIGTFNSEFSVLGWLLTVGARGHLVPYRSLSQPAVRRSINPFAALLNLQNNCPLELHHW